MVARKKGIDEFYTSADNRYQNSNPPKKPTRASESWQYYNQKADLDVVLARSRPCLSKLHIEGRKLSQKRAA